MKAYIMGMMVLALVGCDSVAGCETSTSSFDVLYASSTYEIDMKIIAAIEQSGGTCQSKAIRNAFGTEIGREYTCTRCD